MPGPASAAAQHHPCQSCPRRRCRQCRRRQSRRRRCSSRPEHHSPLTTQRHAMRPPGSGWQPPVLIHFNRHYDTLKSLFSERYVGTAGRLCVLPAATYCRLQAASNTGTGVVLSDRSCLSLRLNFAVAGRRVGRVSARNPTKATSLLPRCLSADFWGAVTEAHSTALRLHAALRSDAQSLSPTMPPAHVHFVACCVV